MNQNLRDAILFLAGIAGIYHETVIAPAPREALLVLFAAMCGLPFVLRGEESRKR